MTPPFVLAEDGPCEVPEYPRAKTWAAAPLWGGEGDGWGLVEGLAAALGRPFTAPRAASLVPTFEPFAPIVWVAALVTLACIGGSPIF